MKKKGLAFALSLSMALPLTFHAYAAPQDLTVKSVRFNESRAPETVAEMASTFTTASVTVTYSNGTVKKFPLSYNTLYNTTDQFTMSNGQKLAAGTPIDVNGQPVLDKSVDGKSVNFISDAPDANSLLRPMADGSLYLVSHLEYTSIDSAGKDAWRRIPASMTLTKLMQNKETGELKVMTADKVDFKDANGLWVPCNGSLSPWNTHLGSEEYEPDARSFEENNAKNDSVAHVKEFAKLYFGDEKKANPYNYGFIPEVIVDEKGQTKVVKHYSVGRRSVELMLMMPDEKTAYFGDDGNNTMLFRFVADKARDLSSGTLYAAKFNQTSAEKGGAGTFDWIKLGSTTNAEVKAFIDKGIKFSDIFETSATAKDGFTAVKQYSYGATEYLKLKPGMEKAAAFLESRRYGALLGATAEFNKMEGLAINAKDKKLYMAIADLGGSMTEDTAKTEPVDHIRFPKMKAGAVYELSLDNNYTATSMNAIVVGEDLKTPDAYGNKANANKIAGPDNLSFSESTRYLFIGEDSSQHINNFVWAYDIETGRLVRVLSVPAGAESTGLQVAEDRNGFSYVMSNFQHPGDALDSFAPTAVKLADLKAEIDKTLGINKTGKVGYIAGIPKLGSFLKK